LTGLLAKLWTSEGRIDRRTYALVGLIGFAIKHNLDRLVATFGFHRPWTLFNYWMPLRDVPRVTQVPGDQAIFLATMVAISLPFIWVGVVLTLKRLRSADAPPVLVALFFLPFVNLLFFVVLCLLPERDQVKSVAAAQPSSTLLARLTPENQFGSAAVALLVTVPVGFATAVLGANVLRNYGWGTFVAIPFTIGSVAAFIYGIHQARSLAACIGVACLAVTLLGFALLALAVEGLFCLVMAIPLALPLAAFGGTCAYFVQKLRWRQASGTAFVSALLLFAPGIEFMEHAMAKPAPVFMVRTQLDVKAPPETVWKEVVAFTEIAPPTEWLFRAGIAYPIRAELVGSGVGAERHCVFSTGAFLEPIQVWDPPRHLKFSVTSNPPPMEEWTPYKHIEPPHLHGFLVSEGGQFLLTPLPDGGTRLEGTTWYQHGLWPAQYWKFWSDAIIHRIHLRVLRHIRDEAEAKNPR
jgi:hypothetical protein